AGADVADRYTYGADLGRTDRGGGEARLGLYEEVVGAHAFHGRDVAVAGDLAGHEARELAAQVGAAEAGALEGAGGEVLHQHVGARDEGLEQRGTVVGLEVQHHRLLALVEPHEVRAVAARGRIVATREV